MYIDIKHHKQKGATKVKSMTETACMLRPSTMAPT